MKCEYCENEVPAGINRCPSCGAAVNVSISLPQKRLTQNQSEQIGLQSQMRAGVYTEKVSIGFKNKWVFILLGIFLGVFGIHNFYSGHIGRGILKILVTICLLPSHLEMCIWVWIWAFIEVCTVRIDAKGRPFTTEGGEF